MCFISFLRANSRGWTSMRSCMWVVTPTTHCLPKPLALRPVLLVRHCSVYGIAVKVLMCRFIMMFLLCRLYPSAGHPRGRSDLQRPGPQLYGCHKLSHLQRPPMSGQSLQTHGYISNIRDIGGFIMSVSSMSPFRMEEPVKTQRPACTSAAAPEDSPAATASITHPCTVTQVQTVQSS